MGTNPGYTAYELEHVLATTKARFLIAEPEVLKAPRQIALQLGISNDRILLLAEPETAKAHGHVSWRALLGHGEEDWVKFDDLETAKNTTAFLLMSSGTTGKFAFQACSASWKAC